MFFKNAVAGLVFCQAANDITINNSVSRKVIWEIVQVQTKQFVKSNYRWIDVVLGHTESSVGLFEKNWNPTKCFDRNNGIFYGSETQTIQPATRIFRASGVWFGTSSY